MPKPSSSSRLALIALSATLVLALLASASLQVLAQGNDPSPTPDAAQTPEPAGTPDPEAGSDGAGDSDAKGSAEWTFAEDTFTSNYPQGFSFSAQLESSAGEVARARVVWTHAPGTQRSRPAQYDAETDRWVATWNATGGDAVPPGWA